jgi:hypothetical protein
VDQEAGRPNHTSQSTLSQFSLAFSTSTEYAEIVTDIVFGNTNPQPV